MPRRGERGLSLVDATVVLMVISALTAIAAPMAADYVNDARQVRARADVEAIGSAIVRMLRDTGSRCLRLNGTQECTVTNRVDLLRSEGREPVAIESSLAPDITLPDSEAATNATVNWLPSVHAPVQRDLIEDQLIVNGNANPYPGASFTTGGGPRMKVGWRGAYLNGPIDGDPWGVMYQVNSIFLAVASTASDTSPTPNQLQEGLREAAWNRDTLVMSPGRNGIVETSFGGTSSGGVTAGGDDVVYVIRGGSR